MINHHSEILNALCFDIDDLAFSLNAAKGTRLPNQYLVEQETYALLESLERLNLQATMFIPGYVAERFPELVREITEFSPVRQAARVGNTASGSVIVPKRTGLTNAQWEGEMEES
ncbi:MAG: phage major capsid protein, partial [Deltaproteobacteria bacterium]|nr:phage major capsid protein [Deltaproteobacteria bacterium]